MTDKVVNQWKGYNPRIQISRTFGDENTTLAIGTSYETPVKMEFSNDGLRELIKQLEWALNTEVAYEPHI